MRRGTIPLFILGFAFLIAAMLSSSMGAAAYTDTQASAGMTLYSQKCQGCHGQNGMNGRAPQLNGRADLLTKYGNAAALYEKIHTTMPRNAPGTLTEEQALDATAMIMSWNGVKADGTALTTANAASVKFDSSTTAAPTTAPTQLPKTGDGMLPFGLAIAGMASIAAAIVLRRRSA